MINGRTFPSEPYNFNFTINGSTLNIVDDGQNDLTRAYEEYISCYRQQEGTKMLSFEQWIVTPIFCFKLEGALPSTIDNTAFINTTYRTSSVRNICLHVHIILISYI